MATPARPILFFQVAGGEEKRHSSSLFSILVLKARHRGLSSEYTLRRERDCSSSVTLVRSFSQSLLIASCIQQGFEHGRSSLYGPLPFLRLAIDALWHRLAGSLPLLSCLVPSESHVKPQASTLWRSFRGERLLQWIESMPLFVWAITRKEPICQVIQSLQSLFVILLRLWARKTRVFGPILDKPRHEPESFH